MRVLSVVGARPQFVKLKPMADALRAAGIEHRVVHTGQHYDANMSDAFFVGLELPSPDWNLGVGSGAHGAQTGAMLASLDDLIRAHSFDWVLAYGDTNSTLAAALAAAKLMVPVAHVEAGLRSRNRHMPEEINRIVTDHTSDLLLAPTQLAMENLEEEGLAQRSCLVGDVMVDLVLSLRSGPSAPTPVVSQFISQMDREPYVVATIHRAANTDDPEQLRRLVAGLATIPARVALVAHPRLLSAARTHGITLGSSSISVLEPLAYVDMLHLIAGSAGLVTDSGGLQKEAFVLGVACTTLRAETEWPETLADGMNYLDPVGARLSEVALRKVTSPSNRPYGNGHAAQLIVQELLARRAG